MDKSPTSSGGGVSIPQTPGHFVSTSQGVPETPKAILIQRTGNTGESVSKRRRLEEDVPEILRLETLERDLQYVAAQSTEFAALALATAADLLHVPRTPEVLEPEKQALSKTATAQTQLEARLKELSGLESMSTFEEVYQDEIQLPKGDRIVSGRWVDTEVETETEKLCKA